MAATRERARKGMAESRAKAKIKRKVSVTGQPAYVAAPSVTVTEDAKPPEMTSPKLVSLPSAPRPTPLQVALEAYDKLSDDDREQFLVKRGLRRRAADLVPDLLN